MAEGVFLSMAIYALIFFLGGWGWGQWWAERCARLEKKSAEAGRMSVSMPVNPERAAETLRVLSVLMKKADADAANAGGQ